MYGRLPRAASRVSRHLRFEIGQALYQAELGERHPLACAMQGLKAVEIVSDYRGDTYRGVYTML
jgi:hypothetical protein